MNEKKRHPPLPSKYQGWNAGKGDCENYHSQLGFSILMGRGFNQGGGYSREEPVYSLVLSGHFFVLSVSVACKKFA